MSSQKPNWTTRSCSRKQVNAKTKLTFFCSFLAVINQTINGFPILSNNAIIIQNINYNSGMTSKIWENASVGVRMESNITLWIGQILDWV